MIVHRCKQGTEQWHELRRGKPTASVFDQIIQPKELKLSKASAALKYRLLAERFLGLPDERVGTAAMQAGRENEPKARAWYEMARGIEVEQVGICFTDDGLIGASPDGLVGPKGSVEFKCPEPQTHIKYMLGGAGAYSDYKAQVQGQLWVCQREWCDTVSWCPPFPVCVHRHERDEKFIEALRDAVYLFVAELEAAEKQLADAGAVYLTNETAIETGDERDDALGMTDAEAQQFLHDLMEQSR